MFRNFWKNALIVTGLIVLTVALSMLTSFGCWFKALSGLPCPGCGMTRAWRAVLRGDFRAAWHFHPLFPLVMPIGVGIVMPRFWGGAQSKAAQRFWEAVLILFLGVYAVRMACYFPHTPPLDFNQQAMLPKLLRALLPSSKSDVMAWIAQLVTFVEFHPYFTAGVLAVIAFVAWVVWRERTRPSYQQRREIEALLKSFEADPDEKRRR